MKTFKLRFLRHYEEMLSGRYSGNMNTRLKNLRQINLSWANVSLAALALLATGLLFSAQPALSAVNANNSNQGSVSFGTANRQIFNDSSAVNPQGQPPTSGQSNNEAVNPAESGHTDWSDTNTVIGQDANGNQVITSTTTPQGTGQNDINTIIVTPEITSHWGGQQPNPGRPPSGRPPQWDGRQPIQQPVPPIERFPEQRPNRPPQPSGLSSPALPPASQGELPGFNPWRDNNTPNRGPAHTPPRSPRPPKNAPRNNSSNVPIRPTSDLAPGYEGLKTSTLLAQAYPNNAVSGNVPGKVSGAAQPQSVGAPKQSSWQSAGQGAEVAAPNDSSKPIEGGREPLRSRGLQAPGRPERPGQVVEGHNAQTQLDKVEATHGTTYPAEKKLPKLKLTPYINVPPPTAEESAPAKNPRRLSRNARPTPEGSRHVPDMGTGGAQAPGQAPGQSLGQASQRLPADSTIQHGRIYSPLEPSASFDRGPRPTHGPLSPTYDNTPEALHSGPDRPGGAGWENAPRP